MLRKLFPAILFSLIATPLFAQSDDAVVVVPFGGIQELPVRDLNTQDESISLGTRRVVPVGEDVRVADLKILPDGSHLLADVNGRGVAVTSPDGMTYRYILDEFMRMTSVRAASVGTYFAPGEPSIVAVADSASEFVSLRDVTTGSVSWFERLSSETSRADIVQIVTLPNNQVAAAFNWTTNGVSGFDIFDITTFTAPTRFANVAHPENPPNTVIVPTISTMRDLMLLPDDNFLVTSRFSVFSMSRTGDVNWTVAIGDDVVLAGEFASARLLPSGKIAVATFQPGEWSRPNANHRIHWLDGDSRSVVESSDVFLTAPVRVEPFAGHGGTGSFGFTAGLDDIGKGDADDVTLDRLAFLNQETVVGDRLIFSATFTNPSTFSVALNTIIVEAFRGECGPRDGIASEIGRASSVAISPQGTFILDGDFLVTSTFGTGPWCAFVRFEDVFGNWFERGEGVPFSIVTSQTESNSTTDSRNLPFDTFDGDMGQSDLGGDMGMTTPPSDDGCCATQGRQRQVWPLFVVIMAAIARFGRRKKRSCA